ncbi:hypothetical protein [Sorangium sp. So ce124]
MSRSSVDPRSYNGLDQADASLCVGKSRIFAIMTWNPHDVWDFLTQF